MFYMVYLWKKRPMTWLLTPSSFLVMVFIHKNRCMKSKPNFYVFHKELCHYVSSLKCMEKKNAMKLCKLVEEPYLTENTLALPPLSIYFTFTFLFPNITAIFINFFLWFLSFILHSCNSLRLVHMPFLVCIAMYHAHMLCTIIIQ